MLKYVITLFICMPLIACTTTGGVQSGHGGVGLGSYNNFRNYVQQNIKCEWVSASKPGAKHQYDFGCHGDKWGTTTLFLNENNGQLSRIRFLFREPLPAEYFTREAVQANKFIDLIVGYIMPDKHKWFTRTFWSKKDGKLNTPSLAVRYNFVENNNNNLHRLEIWDKYSNRKNSEPIQRVVQKQSAPLLIKRKIAKNYNKTTSKLNANSIKTNIENEQLKVSLAEEKKRLNKQEIAKVKLEEKLAKALNELAGSQEKQQEIIGTQKQAMELANKQIQELVAKQKVEKTQLEIELEKAQNSLRNEQAKARRLELMAQKMMKEQAKLTVEDSNLEVDIKNLSTKLAEEKQRVNNEIEAKIALEKKLQNAMHKLASSTEQQGSLGVKQLKQTKLEQELEQAQAALRKEREKRIYIENKAKELQKEQAKLIRLPSPETVELNGKIKQENIMQKIMTHNKAVEKRDKKRASSNWQGTKFVQPSDEDKKKIKSMFFNKTKNEEEIEKAEKWAQEIMESDGSL